MTAADHLQFAIERRQGIGGSDVAALLGLDPRKTPLQLYQEKVLPPAAGAETPAMRRGKFLEAALVKRYCEILPPAEVTPGYRRVDGWRRANLDAFVRSRESLRVVVEGKTVTKRVFRSDWGQPWSDQVPDRHLGQGFWYADLVGADRIDYPVAVLPDDPDEILGLTAEEVIAISDVHVFQVTRRPDIERAILEAAHRFWHEHVLAARPPSVREMADIEAMWPGHVPGQTRPIDAVLGAARELHATKAAIKELEARKEKLEFQIREHAEDDEALTLGGAAVVTLKKTSRAGYTANFPATEFRTLRFTKEWDKALARIQIQEAEQASANPQQETA